jgi:adhesin transport system membrane fusion protein
MTAKDLDTLDGLKAEANRSGWRVFGWLVMAMLVAGFAWAYVTQIDEVAVAAGEVVPRGQVKVIQHLEGGIIQKINVAEGDRVTAGQPLLHLDLAPSAINPAELQVRLDGLRLTRARLQAESEGRDLAFPPDLIGKRPELEAAEQEAYTAHLKSLESAKSVLKRQLRQRELDIDELRATQKAVTNDLQLARQNLAMSQELLKDELTSKMEHLERVREVEALQGRLNSIEPTIPRAAAALAEARERLREEDLKFRGQARDLMNETEQAIARTRELLNEADKQVRRTEIRSPIDGTVKNLRYHTIGGVVRPSEPIMEIVPASENLVIEAKLNPIDRGYVKAGQPAIAKISTYDFVRYGGLEGHVVHIGADSSVTQDGTPYYKVIMETDRSHLGEKAGELPILPGMQATVDIHTGQRSVLEFILKPLLRIRSEAFRER